MKTYLRPEDRLKEMKEPKIEVEDRFTVKELKQMCKDKGLTGYSKLKEAELIELLGL